MTQARRIGALAMELLVWNGKHTRNLDVEARPKRSNNKNDEFDAAANRDGSCQTQIEGIIRQFLFLTHRGCLNAMSNNNSIGFHKGTILWQMGKTFLNRFGLD